jgi:methionyl-tRNA formyltransferase
MKLVYMGTPQFAVQPLRALADAGSEILGVVTRIDKPSGRGRSLAAPPVKTASREMSLRVFQPNRVRDLSFIESLRDLAPEAIVVAAYGQILPPDILALPKFGCINIHASLLPSCRGAAPINWAIIRGAAETGITIMQMDQGMDTGGILMQESLPIDPRDTAGSLTEKLSTLGAQLIVRALSRIEAGSLAAVAQDSARATFAPMLKKEDGLIDWTRPADEIANRVRGLSPWPGAFTYLDGKLVKILEAEAMPGSAAAGVLAAEKSSTLFAGTGRGMIRIATLQQEGRKPISAAEFLRGYRGIEGKKFGQRT